jgi:hypothetical protein
MAGGRLESVSIAGAREVDFKMKSERPTKGFYGEKILKVVAFTVAIRG